MSLRINQNVLAIKSHGQLSITAGRLDKSMEKLSSGLRINRAADDAAGLAISEKMRRQIRGLSRAVLNAQDGISMIQSAEGAMGEAQANLQRMRELAIQAGNDTLTSNDRLEIQKEVNQLKDDLNRIAFNTEFNTKRLLDGSQSALVSSTSAYANGIVRDTAIGGDYQISLTVLDGGLAQMLRSQTMTNYYDGTLADGETQLQSIAQFYDGNGSFAFESPQTITVNGNGKNVEITIDKSTTLGFLTGQLASAIQSGSGLDMQKAKVDAITTAASGIAADGGYIEITSGIVGELGEISFSGDNAVLNGLGFSAIREASNNVVKVTALDKDGNALSQTTNDDRVAGILQGVDVKFSSQAAQIASVGGLVEGLKITVAATVQINNVGGVAANDFTINLAAGDYTMEQIVRQINATAASVVPGFEATIVDGELRLNYTPAQISLTNTFEIANSTNIAQLGFTNGTKSGMTTGVRDTTYNVWGFSAYDATSGAVTVSAVISAGDVSARFTLMTTVTSAQAADLIAYSTVYANASTAFANAGAKVVMDQVGNSIVLTNTRLGREIATNGTVTKSQIQLSWVHTGVAAVDTLITNTFDWTNGQNETGTGEKNFRFHIVSNQPQFHIGADKGQTMEVSMGNMSVEALGLENLDMTSIDGASKALGKISRALDHVSSERSKLGAYQNRLEYAISNLRSMHSNMVSAESRLRDADIAQEMIEFTRNQIVNQSGTAMLAQANLVPQGVLQLLR
jgi:flagellin